MNNLNITLSNIVDTTSEFIANVCNNIGEKFNNIDADYKEYQIKKHLSNDFYYYDEENGNKLFGIESNIDQPFKVGYQLELSSNQEISGINGAIFQYSINDIKTDLSTFLTDECGFNLIEHNNVSQKQFLVIINNIASFLFKHINYFVEADHLNLNQLNPFGSIPSTNISKNTLVIYVPTNIIETKPTLSEILNWENLTEYGLNTDVMDAKTINALMSNLFNNYLAVDRVKRYQYAMTVCSSSSSSSCCSSSSCSSSSSSSYFVAYMKLF